ncbi:MAG TPA: carbamoyltransferase [Opitutaceae bacterium]|nr:carbamoyltransferase [Opitutaceae bacterium]
MSRAILGLSAFYHDSAAALVVDGRVVAAAQEERFSRRKHDAGFPTQAIAYCLDEAGLTPEQLDHVAFYEKPLLKFERLLETHLATAPRGFRSFFRALPQWIHQKLQLPREINRGLGGRYRRRLVFLEHHEAHAASAFFPSPFDEAAILTADGVGEWTTSTLGHGEGRTIALTHEMRFPHSLGLLYSAFTSYCGFRVNSGEYKLMGLAPFGRPVFADTILERLMDLRADGSFRLDLSYFNYGHGLTMTSPKFHRLFGGPPRPPEGHLTARHCDLAASIQRVTETVMLRAAAHLHRLTGQKNLCLAGGVGLNCVVNGRLLRESPFERIWIQPAAGDAGGALGAALFVWHQLLENDRRPVHPDGQCASLLGPAPMLADIESVLRAERAVYRWVASEDELCADIAALLAAGKVVGWVQGRMEFGPRGLGSRSILGDPRNPAMQSLMNRKIKFRESFRPFAPAVLREQAAEYFDLRPDQESPYMLLAAPVRADKRTNQGPTIESGLARVTEIRSVVPAVTHVDYSARIQTVDRDRQPRFHRLLEAFERQTGCPVLINTSFNIRGEPIVCTPNDAYRCFMATDMDVLVIDSYVLRKEDQPSGRTREWERYRTAFGRD